MKTCLLKTFLHKTFLPVDQKMLDSDISLKICSMHHVFRANGLENACKDKDATIDALRREIEELRTITLETPHGALPAEGEHITKVSMIESPAMSVIRTWNFAGFGVGIRNMSFIMLA